MSILSHAFCPVLTDVSNGRNVALICATNVRLFVYSRHIQSSPKFHSKKCKTIIFLIPVKVPRKYGKCAFIDPCVFQQHKNEYHFDCFFLLFSLRFGVAENCTSLRYFLDRIDFHARTTSFADMLEMKHILIRLIRIIHLPIKDICISYRNQIHRRSKKKCFLHYYILLWHTELYC